MIYEKTGLGIRITLKVTPKASSNSCRGIEEVLPGQLGLKVWVTAAPEDGKANKAVIELLSKLLRLPKSSISVIQGETSRLKTVMIYGDEELIINSLEKALTN